MSLGAYKKKRDFDKSPEPRPGEAKAQRTRFVVQEHHASHLHWDFRLEMDGVLKSWALPKGPPTEPGVRRLAVATEDHPVDYISFEGVIPEGQYGAGTVKIWDRGEYKLRLRTGKQIKVALAGAKLEGNYVLVHMNATLRSSSLRSTSEDNWLLIKERQ
jgi:DNA ligase D-like protein (predicted 3'-phosphoesterase)